MDRKGPLVRAFVAAIAIVSALACGRSSPKVKTRALIVRGLPQCPREGRLARPIIARLDDTPGLFADRFTTQRVIELSPRTGPEARDGRIELTLPRQRMKATLRVGACRATSLSTWDCAAASWMFEREIAIDGGTEAIDVTATDVDVACAAK